MAMKKLAVRKGRERRGSERADARLSMRVEAGATAGAARIVTESQNISASGVYCHASHYLAPLSKVQLTIILPRVPGGGANVQELLKCDGIVVRCEQRENERSGAPYELACMFTALEPAARRRLEEFVTWRNLQALRAALSAPSSRRVASDRNAARSAPKPTANGRKPARAASGKGVRTATRTGARSNAGRARG
jgi:PilZ domain-containing protein